MQKSFVIQKECYDGELKSPSFYRITSRKRGYNSLRAVAEPIDNSTELTVGAKAIQCHIIQNDRNSTSRILICDDGYGMTFDQLVNAMRFGCKNEKRNNETLGYNGVGFKEAGLFFGQRVEVWTKHKSGQLSYAVVDVNCPKGEDIFDYPITLEVVEVSEFGGEYETPYGLLSKQECGTIVSYAVERNNYQTAEKLMDELADMISIRYSRFMINDNKTYHIDIYDPIRNNLVRSRYIVPKTVFDTTNCIPLGSGDIEVAGGSVVHYDGYYVIPDNRFTTKTTCVKRTGRYRACNYVRNGVVITSDKGVDMKINYNTVDQQGTDSSALNCFRFVVYANAASDLPFNVTASKVVGGFDSWDTDLQMKISNIITPMVARCIELEKQYTTSKTPKDQLREVINNVSLILNTSRDFQRTVRSIMNKVNGILNRKNIISSGLGNIDDNWVVRKHRIELVTKEEKEEREKKEKEKEEKEKKEREKKDKLRSGGGEGDTMYRKNGDPDVNIISARLGKNVKLHNDQPNSNGTITLVINEDNPLYTERYPEDISDLSRRVSTDSTTIGLSESLAKKSLKQELGENYSEDQIDRFLTLRDDIYNKLLSNTKPFKQ